MTRSRKRRRREKKDEEERVLPPEIWMHVFSFLDVHDSLAVTHVCRLWRAIALQDKEIKHLLEEAEERESQQECSLEDIVDAVGCTICMPWCLPCCITATIASLHARNTAPYREWIEFSRTFVALTFESCDQPSGEGGNQPQQC